MLQRQRENGKISQRSAAYGNAMIKAVVACLMCAGAFVTFAAGAASTPIKLAIFEFELEDFSAGASAAGVTSPDAAHLENVTQKVREILAQSDRYELIDVGGVRTPAGNSQTLRDCDGCDAGIAAKLGAQQSLVGVVSRISRTEYVVRFQVRDTRTGAIVAAGDSGLQMGADYSWSRGAARLVKARLLEARPSQ